MNARHDVSLAELIAARSRTGPDAMPAPRALAPLLWIHEVQPVLDQRYVIEGVMAPGTAVLTFGDSNSGKTFFTLDMALHVAGGQPWRDRRVIRGLVLYVAAEGGHGIRNRLAAYRKTAPWALSADFAVLPQAVDLLDPHADTLLLIDRVREAETACGEKAALIVLDTLARVTPGANENAGEDMSAFIGNVDRLRAETGAAVLIVHHAGKDTTKGARGHSSLRAAVDTEILIEGQNGTRRATVTKQRDLPGGERWAFDLVPVELGTDQEGRVIQSCVVAVTEPKRQQPTGKQQIAILRIVEAETEQGRPIIGASDITKLARERLDMPKSSARYAVLGLIDAGFLVETVGGLMLSESKP